MPIFNHEDIWVTYIIDPCTVGWLCNTYPCINLLFVIFQIFCSKYYSKLQFSSKNYSKPHRITGLVLIFTLNWDFLPNLFSCKFKNLIFIFQTFWLEFWHDTLLVVKWPHWPLEVTKHPKTWHQNFTHNFLRNSKIIFLNFWVKNWLNLG